MSEDPSSDSTKRERERAGAGQVALVSSPAERGSECDGGRRAVSEPAVARAAASAGERVRRMHTEMPWLRSGWCGRSGGVAWVHAATRLREREQMASERASCAVPRRKEFCARTGMYVRTAPHSEATYCGASSRGGGKPPLPRPCRMIGVKVTVAAGRLRRIWRWWRRWRLRKVVSNLTAARRSAGEVAADHTGWCE